MKEVLPGWAKTQEIIPAREALSRLREGNARFLQNVRRVDPNVGDTARVALVASQKPFAIVLSCSDSRVPSEIVFDQGLGDLFVIRVAGNIVAPSLVGSVEFAAATFGTQLVVVMGHTRCGAVKATIEAVLGGTASASKNIEDIVDRIRPSVTELIRCGAEGERLFDEAIRANVRASANHLRHASRILEDLKRKDELLVVGAEYSLESGVVDFFDGVPD